MTKEELEKEAEEYIKEHTFFDEEYGVQSLDVVSKTIFKDGAEFGYKLAHEEMDYLNQHWKSEEERKANEWHYVKDGDLPKQFGYYLVALKSIAYKGFVCEVVYFTGSIFTKEGEISDNVYAWKEIVLPKESE